MPESPVLVTLVLPCLNEVASVGACVTEALDAFALAGLVGEVVVADNGSTDGSAEAALRAGARVVPATTPGYGAALQAGFRAARGTVLVMGDADLTYDFSKIDLLVRPILDDTADLVLGGRLDAATQASMPFLHRFVGTPAITFLVSRASGGIPISDSQSGYRAFRKAKFDVLDATSPGMEFASEMLLKARWAEWRMLQVETGYRPRVGESKLNTFSDGWRHLRLIVELAPQLVLLWPGLALLALGLAIQTATVARGGDIQIGSWSWQPTFFGNICSVVGAQAAMVGAIVSQRSVLVRADINRAFGFASGPTSRRRLVTTGILLVGLGIMIDAGISITGFSTSSPGRAQGLASLAGTALVIGPTLIVLGLLLHVIVRDSAPSRTNGPITTDDLSVGSPFPREIQSNDPISGSSIG